VRGEGKGGSQSEKGVDAFQGERLSANWEGGNAPRPQAADALVGSQELRTGKKKKGSKTHSERRGGSFSGDSRRGKGKVIVLNRCLSPN